jgi:hemerythrin superfamily protein
MTSLPLDHEPNAAELNATDLDAADLVDLLVADHRRVEQLFAEIETTAHQPHRRRAAIETVIAELNRHAAVEERYLYPATRVHLPAGDDIADHEIREHDEAEEMMRRLVRLDDGDPEFDPLINTLMADIRRHVQEEETELFPRLRQACGWATLVRLGRQALAAGHGTPTRCRPDRR